VDSPLLAIVDIDGVVADVRHRLKYVEARPKDWDAFFAAAKDDPPLAEGIARVEELLTEHEVVFLTGRPERCRADTERWLTRHGIGGRRVIMRGNRDRSPARRTKLREIRQLAGPEGIAVVLDDDAAVCADLAAAGYRVELADWMPRPPALHDAQERQGRT
jgi:hypothetical protein